MTLQTQHTANAPATLTDEQRRRVSDALENAQSVNTCRNYASQFGKFRTWCGQEGYSPLPVQPEVLAAYAAELADDGKSMSTIRLAVAAIVDAHRRVGLESPQTAGVSETLRGLSRQVGVSQKQARPLDADAADWTSRWHPFSLMRDCASRRMPARCQWRGNDGPPRRREVVSVS